MAYALRISGLIDESIVDGRGIRYVVFTQGCPHGCPECHNPDTHSFTGGREISTDEIFSELKKNPLLKGVTFSGGEPFCQPQPLAALAKKVHAETKLDVTVYTGYTLEKLQAMNEPSINALLNEADVLIDGPFIAAEKDLTLKFRGSKNQRVIDMNRTRAENRICTID
jgi:anaerobic ribonucleoside-triphosphate reductase activating protein